MGEPAGEPTGEPRAQLLSSIKMGEPAEERNNHFRLFRSLSKTGSTPSAFRCLGKNNLISRGSTPNIRGMLSPAMFDSIFDIEAFLCPATMSYQDPPRATRNHRGHQQPPGATGATRSATRSHLEQLEATRSHQDLPKSHQEPPGLFHDIAAPGAISTKTLVKLAGPGLKLQ